MSLRQYALPLVAIVLIIITVTLSVGIGMTSNATRNIRFAFSVKCSACHLCAGEFSSAYNPKPNLLTLLTITLFEHLAKNFYRNIRLQVTTELAAYVSEKKKAKL